VRFERESVRLHGCNRRMLELMRAT
jgi:hypothetical protein